MKVLFVCTGNTCRSSMAEAILKSYPGFEVRSVGVAADSGSKASPQAVRVLSAQGIDLTLHRAKLLGKDAIDWADLILTMTNRHKEVVQAEYPSAASKTFTLKEFALRDEDRLALTEELHQLYKKVDAVRQEFNSHTSPTIGELQARRAELIEELAQIEHQLAELQVELRSAVREERQQIAKLEAYLASQDVADPFGQSDDVYSECYNELADLINRAVKRLNT